MTKLFHRAAGARIATRTASAGRATAFVALAALLFAPGWMARPGEWRGRRIVSDSPPVHYSITDLGTDGGRFINVSARSINDRGQVVCTASLPGFVDRVFLWENGSFKDLGPRVIGNGDRQDLNNRGEVVSCTIDQRGDREPHVVIYRGGKMVDTGVRGYGFGIDDHSRVVGETYGHHRAFLYDRGKTIDLGTLGGPFAVAQRINNQGQIVGTADLPSGLSHAFLYSGGKMRDLGTLGGKSSLGCAINSRGWVVGLSGRKDGSCRAFLYRNGKMEELEDMDDRWLLPAAINSTGTIVGAKAVVVPIVWIGGHIYNLQDLIDPDSGWSLHGATDINDLGQITAWGRHAGEKGLRSCILTPVVRSRSDGSASGSVA